MSVQQEKFKAIADKIRHYLGISDLIKPSDFADKIDAVAEDRYTLGVTDGYGNGVLVGNNETTERYEKMQAMMSEELSVALTSGAGNKESLETNINQAKSDIASICNMLNDYEVPVAVGQPSSTYPQKIVELVTEKQNAGIEQGKQSAYDEFWDSFQNNGKRSDYEYVFGGGGWNDTTFKPKYIPIKPRYAGSMFEKCGATDVDLTDVVEINSQCWGYVRAFKGFTGLVKFGDFYCSHDNCQEIFMGCTNLKSVRKFTSQSTTSYSNTFYNCTSLTDITFYGTVANNFDIRYSPLNRASIESLIGCLSSTATGKTLMLNKTAKEAAFTDEEWVTLISPKSNQYDGNWTISLV